MISPSTGKLTLNDFISRQNYDVTEKKEKIKYLKRALKDLDLNYCSIPLPLSTFNQTSTDSHEKSEDENSSDEKQDEKGPTPDFDETNNFLSKLGEHEALRRRYAEERRKEYNEYLKEAKFAHSRIKALERKSEAFRLQSPIRSYAELLEEKRANEKAYRNMNDHHICDANSLEPDFFGYNAKHQKDEDCDILNWQAKNSVSHVESLVPKNRLLATHSSRVRAFQYKEELRKQIEDKHRREEEKRKLEKEEDRLIEARSQEQRLRILREYEEEKFRQQMKADSLARKQEIIKEMIEESPRSGKTRLTHTDQDTRRDDEKGHNFTKEKNINDGQNKPQVTPIATVNRLPRSPSYLQMRSPKSSKDRKSRISLETRFEQIGDNYFSPVTTKKTPSLSGRAKQFTPTLSIRNGGDTSRDFSNPPDIEPAKYKPPSDNEIKRSTPLLKTYNKLNNKDANNNNQSPNQSVNSYSPVQVKSSNQEDDRVLTRLSEVRRKMQEDHQRMLNQLKDQSS